MTKTRQANQTPKKRGQRPDTKRLKPKFLEVFKRKAGNISESCQAVGIVRDTYYHWMEKDPAFKTAVMAVQESLIDYTESKLLQLIQDKNPIAILFKLKCHGKSRGYEERSTVDQNVNLVNTDQILKFLKGDKAE